MSDWPVLHSRSLDYVDCSYDTENTELTDYRTTVRHRLTGKSLVRRLVEAGQAHFAVEIAAPYLAYRTIEIAPDQQRSYQTQNVEFDPQFSRNLLSIRPIVIHRTTGSFRDILDCDRDGVHGEWNKKVVNFPPGAILASEDFFRPSSGLSVMKLAADSERRLNEGAFEVKTSEDDGFIFKVILHKGLFDDLQNPGGATTHRDSILTGALISALSQVRRYYVEVNEDEPAWKQFPNLRILNQMIKQLGIVSWEDENFDPALAATALKPIVFTPTHDDE